jgi:hypothetical protein
MWQETGERCIIKRVQICISLQYYLNGQIKGLGLAGYEKSTEEKRRKFEVTGCTRKNIIKMGLKVIAWHAWTRSTCLRIKTNS